MNSIKELRAQVAEAEVKIEFLHTWEGNTVAIKDITIEQKIKAFDELYSTIHDLVKQAVDEGYMDEDAKHWVYEQAMNMTLGAGVWKVINTLVG